MNVGSLHIMITILELNSNIFDQGFTLIRTSQELLPS